MLISIMMPKIGFKLTYTRVPKSLRMGIFMETFPFLKALSSLFMFRGFLATIICVSDKNVRVLLTGHCMETT